MKITKKMYREELNRIHEGAPVHKNGPYQQRTRPYGDYLYFQDRIMFDAEFAEWKKDKEKEVQP